MMTPRRSIRNSSQPALATLKRLIDPALLARTLLGTLLVGLTLAACGGLRATPTAAPIETVTSPPTAAVSPLPSPTPTPPPGKVTIWLDWSPAELEALGGIIEDYVEMHPGTRFQVIYQRPGTLQAEFEAAAGSGEEPSILIASSELGPGWVEEGLIRDVSNFVLPEHREALQPMAWEQVARGEEITGLPLELQGTVLYRNSSLAPEPADTVDELLAASRESREAGRAGASFDLGFRRAAPFLRTCKGELRADERVDPVGRPQGLCWLRLLDRLGGAGPVTFDTGEDKEAFLAGQSMWLLGSTDELLELQEGVGAENLAVDPWPLYTPTGEMLTGYVWSQNAYFPKAAPDEDFEAAWSFSIHLLAPENQRLLSNASGVRHLPTHSEVALEDPLMGAASRVLLGGLPLPDQAALEDVVRELETAVRLVVGQGGDPELALDLALNEIRAARIPTVTPTPTAVPTMTPSPTVTPFPSPPPG